MEAMKPKGATGTKRKRCSLGDHALRLTPQAHEALTGFRPATCAVFLPGDIQMAASQDQISVIGAGSWGTALACHLGRAGHRVKLWAYEPEVAESVNRHHVNRKFLPDYQLDKNVSCFTNFSEVLSGSGMALLVMPSHVYRRVLEQAAPHLEPGAVLVSCSKGIEQDTGYTMCEVAEDVLPKEFHRSLCCLSGPSFAKEVAAGQATAVTVACRNEKTAKKVQVTISTQSFRAYTSPDLVGVELGGAVKNPLAIAAGMVAGLGLGLNTVAALITRGLAEMTRLSQAKGGQKATLSGLAGLGDLVLTCTGDLSRNRTVGFRLGRGEDIGQITSSMEMVAEGVHNTKTIRELAQRLEVEMPIVNAVYNVIYQNRPPQQALLDLMSRDLKPEHY